MTATPRIYGEQAKTKADDGDVALASMDDEDIDFCNCLTSDTTQCTASPGACPAATSCASICRTNSGGGMEDLFCQVAISAVSGGIFSDNIQFFEYGR